MKRNNEERQLTRAEMEIMNMLWSTTSPEEGLTTHQIIGQYPEPKPAYSTIATFLKILVNKGFVGSRKQEGGGKTLVLPIADERGIHEPRDERGEEHILRRVAEVYAVVFRPTGRSFGRRPARYSLFD